MSRGCPPGPPGPAPTAAVSVCCRARPARCRACAGPPPQQAALLAPTSGAVAGGMEPGCVPATAPAVSALPLHGLGLPAACTLPCVRRQVSSSSAASPSPATPPLQRLARGRLWRPRRVWPHSYLPTAGHWCGTGHSGGAGPLPGSHGRQRAATRRGSWRQPRPDRGRGGGLQAAGRAAVGHRQAARHPAACRLCVPVAGAYVVCVPILPAVLCVCALVPQGWNSWHQFTHRCGGLALGEASTVPCTLARPPARRPPPLRTQPCSSSRPTAWASRLKCWAVSGESEWTCGAVLAAGCLLRPGAVHSPPLWAERQRGHLHGQAPAACGAADLRCA